MKTIYNFTNIASHYRTSLWSKLLNDTSIDFHFAFGNNKKMKIKEIDFLKPNFSNQKHKLHFLKNCWIKERILIFQFGIISRCLFKKMDIAIFLGEFHILSTWVAVLICKIKGIKVVFWTHGIYGNETKWKQYLRVFFYKMADELILYERRAKKLLIEKGFKDDKLKVIFNSLDYDTHKKLRNNQEITQDYSPIFFEDNKLPYLIFVGRLTKFKKIDMLIHAVTNINILDFKVNLLLVGDGNEKENLTSIVAANKMSGNIFFYGASYDESELAKLIYHASMCVSPGNVGLTAIHSLSYGTPVCTHSNFSNQMPEVESIEEGKTGVFFEEDNVEDLEIVIQKWLKQSKSRKLIREDCYQIIDSFYNPYYQLEIMKSL